MSDLYDDKVDGVISKEFYEKKKTEYENEHKDIEKAIEKHNKAGHKYRELGLHLYEVSQRGKDIFMKKLPEKKQILLGTVNIL